MTRKPIYSMSNQGPVTISCTVDHPKDWPCQICSPPLTKEEVDKLVERTINLASISGPEIATSIRRLAQERDDLRQSLNKMGDFLEVAENRADSAPVIRRAEVETCVNSLDVIKQFIQATAGREATKYIIRLDNAINYLQLLTPRE